MNVDNGQDIMDSRDIIARIEELGDAGKEKAASEEKEEAAEPGEEKAGKTAETAEEKSTEEH